MKIRIGQVGTKVTCLKCGSLQTIEPFSQVRETVEDQDPVLKASGFQFGLRGLMLLFLPFAALAWLAERTGVAELVSLLFGLFVYASFVVTCALIIDRLEKIKSSFWD